MMYWKPAPTIYEQKRSEFMNKILIYFIVGNGIYWIHISMASTHLSTDQHSAQ